MSGDITRTHSTHKGRHRQSSIVTSKRSANRLTRSGALGASVWAPTVGFATLGMATVAAMTMVALDNGSDPNGHTEAVGSPQQQQQPEVTRTPADTPAARQQAQPAQPAKLHLQNVSLDKKVADASSTLQARTASIKVTTAKVTRTATKSVPKVNPAPAPAPKGGTTPPKSGGDGSGGSTGGGSDAPAPAPAPVPAPQQPVIGVNAPTGTGVSVNVGGLIHLGL